MTDREYLELAAKAAGYVLVWGEKYNVGGDLVDCTDMPYIQSAHPDELDAYWNPLTDDGDALRLAVKLGFAVSVCTGYTAILDGQTRVNHDSDPYAATRRAIVRAAAEIGERMK